MRGCGLPMRPFPLTVIADANLSLGVRGQELSRRQRIIRIIRSQIAIATARRLPSLVAPARPVVQAGTCFANPPATCYARPERLDAAGNPGGNAMRKTIAILIGLIATAAASGAAAETLEGRGRAARLLELVVRRVRAAAGLLQAGRARHRDPLHRGRRLDADAGRSPAASTSP